LLELLIAVCANSQKAGRLLEAKTTKQRYKKYKLLGKCEESITPGLKGREKFYPAFLTTGFFIKNQ